MTAEGYYSLKAISLRIAIDIAQQSEIDSAIAHQATATAMSKLLGINVPVNRQKFSQKPRQQALVFELNGSPPRGTVLSREELKEKGYSWKLLTRKY
jgi:hypothetical protein